MGNALDLFKAALAALAGIWFPNPRGNCGFLSLNRELVISQGSIQESGSSSTRERDF